MVMDVTRRSFLKMTGFQLPLWQADWDSTFQ